MPRPAVLARSLAAAFLVAALLGPPGVPPAAATSPECPPPPVTVEKIWAVVDVDAQLRCFGSRLLTFRAFVVDLPNLEGIGGTSATSISPRWLDGLNGSWAIFSTGPGRPEIGAFVPPGLGRCYPPDDLATCPFRWYWGRWATVTAHFDGPVARTCRIASQPPGESQTTADAIAACRKELIVLGVGPIEPPATATAAPHDDVAAASPAVPLALGGLALGAFLVSGRRRSRRP